jgi:hypothetical protein
LEYASLQALRVFMRSGRRNIRDGIGWLYFQQSVFDEFDQQFRQIVVQQLWRDVILRQ